MATSGTLARILVFGGHGGNEPMETRLACQFRVECGGDHVALANGHDPAIVERGENIDPWAGALDDGRPDEDAVDGLVAEHRHGDLRFERVQLAPECVAPHADIEEREYGLIASMHNQASTWAVPVGFRRHALDADGLMGDAPFWGPFWDHPGFTADERTLVLATTMPLVSSSASIEPLPSSSA